MISSTREYKRVRPFLGTFFGVTLSGLSETCVPPEFSSQIQKVFYEVEILEGLFSKFSRTSLLTQMNEMPVDSKIVLPEPFHEVLQAALDFWHLSGGAFNPFFPQTQDLQNPPWRCFSEDGRAMAVKTGAAVLDLNGIAKGAIVDKAVSLLAAVEGTSGVVNAGGDLRGWNRETLQAPLRLGDPERPLLRLWQTSRPAVAASSPGISLQCPVSSTRYGALRAGIGPHHTVVASAWDCATADALTKVALYGTPEVIEKCVERHSAQIAVFGPQGDLAEAYGEA